MGRPSPLLVCWGVALLVVAPVLGRLTPGEAHKCAEQYQDILTNEWFVDADLTPVTDMHRRLHETALVGLGEHDMEGNSAQIINQTKAYYSVISNISCTRIVCETGFNAGHSAAVWLSGKPESQLYSFDLGQHDYVYRAIKFYATEAPGRLVSRLGNSLQTLPRALKSLRNQCDIVVVDGGHDEFTALSDMRAFREMANPRFNIFIIDDTGCKEEYCRGPNDALKQAEAEGLVKVLRTFVTVRNGPHGEYERGFTMGVFLKRPMALQGQGQGGALLGADSGGLLGASAGAERTRAGLPQR